MSRAYKVVDAFSEKPLLGNPVAVVLDADGLESATMQAIARWTNLSETTFVLPPTVSGADYRLRIFTPLSELPFAGHPTLGSAHAVLEAGRVQPRNNVLVQECGAGLIRIAVEGEATARRLTLTLPPATLRPLGDPDVAQLERVLGHPVLRTPAPAIVNVGPVWIVAQIPSVDFLLALKPDFARCAELERRLGATGITVFAEYKHGRDLEVRSFAPSCGVNEDPVCGSGNGSVAALLSAHCGPPRDGFRYTATQGRCVGRDGRVAVALDETGTVTIGGACVTCLNGTLEL